MAFTVLSLLGILNNQNFGPWDVLLFYPKAVLLLVYIFCFFHDFQMEEIIKTGKKNTKFHGQKASSVNDLIKKKPHSKKKSSRSAKIQARSSKSGPRQPADTPIQSPQTKEVSGRLMK